MLNECERFWSWRFLLSLSVMKTFKTNVTVTNRSGQSKYQCLEFLRVRKVFCDVSLAPILFGTSNISQSVSSTLNFRNNQTKYSSVKRHLPVILHRCFWQNCGSTKGLVPSQGYKSNHWPLMRYQGNSISSRVNQNYHVFCTRQFTKSYNFKCHSFHSQR